MAVRKIVALLVDIFLAVMPPIPALNKWLATVPILRWTILGVLCHGVMPRLWCSSGLDLQSYVVDNPDQAQQNNNMSDEERFRTKRSKRCVRILKWMRNRNSQMWGTCALLVVTPLTSLIADFLQDDFMFAVDRADGNNMWRQWRPPASDPQRVVPTLFSFVKDNVLAIRKMQQSILNILTDQDGQNLILKAFPSIDPQLLYGALQAQCLETIADIALRFVEVYTSPSEPQALVRMSMPDADYFDREEMASDFEHLCKCCLKEHSTAKVREMYPEPGDLLTDDAQELFVAYGHHCPICTKVVEFSHRTNRAQATSRGPAKPSDMHTVCDGLIISRTQVLHSQTSQKGRGNNRRRQTFKFKKHPKVQKAMSKMKKPKATGKARGQTGNPKWFYLVQKREELKALRLPLHEFQAAMTEKKDEYDRCELVRHAAKDKWRLHIARKAARLVLPSASQNLGDDDQMVDGCGPWKMGDQFWPISEHKFQEWLSNESVMGGLRPAADRRRKKQKEILFWGDEQEARAVPEIKKTCFEKHPGFCEEAHAGIAQKLLHIVDELHHIRSLSLAVSYSCTCFCNIHFHTVTRASDCMCAITEN